MKKIRLKVENDMRERIKNLEKTATANIEELERKIKGEQEENASLHQRLTHSQEAAMTAQHEIETYKFEARSYTKEIDRLKVKLFDLIEREETTHRATVEIYQGVIKEATADPGTELTIIDHDKPTDDTGHRVIITAG